jgi:hypothetical protein
VPVIGVAGALVLGAAGWFFGSTFRFAGCLLTGRQSPGPLKDRLSPPERPQPSPPAAGEDQADVRSTLNIQQPAIGLRLCRKAISGRSSSCSMQASASPGLRQYVVHLPPFVVVRAEQLPPRAEGARVAGVLPAGAGVGVHEDGPDLGVRAGHGAGAVRHQCDPLTHQRFSEAAAHGLPGLHRGL